MAKFKTLLTESKTVKDLIKTLKDYEATIMLQDDIITKDVIYWAEGSINYAEDFSSDFDMTENEFIEFCKDVKQNAKEISRILSRLK